MTIRFNCACGTAMEVPDEFAGRRGKCPKCNSIVTVPTVNKTIKITSGDEKANNTGIKNDQAVPGKVTAQTPGAEERLNKDASLVIRAKCECGNEITVAKHFEGRMTKCNKCGKVFKIAANVQEQQTIPVPNAPVQSPPANSINVNSPPAQTTQEDNVLNKNDEKSVLIPGNETHPVETAHDNDQSEPVLIPVSATGDKSSAHPVMSAKQGTSRISLNKLTKSGLHIFLGPAVTDLYKIRLSLALGLLVIVCLIQFVNTMGWRLPLSIFSVLLLITGIAAIIVGGLVRSIRDIILGCDAVIAVFSTPLFVRIFNIHRGSRMTYTALKALIGWAGVGYVLLSGFAVLVIVSILLAVRKKS